MSPDEGQIQQVLDDNHPMFYDFPELAVEICPKIWDLDSPEIHEVYCDEDGIRQVKPHPFLSACLKAAVSTSMILHISGARAILEMQNWQTYHFTSTKTISASIILILCQNSVYAGFLITRQGPYCHLTVLRIQSG
ncbi:hypothetical protein FPCIR_14159 [Fusarium pseudocircinatum]|uniref:Uncharacterized protein n=1 Tax=Fusarium pseudocircinatum TaxID=56676 RepID=A0A8H5KGR8_9HYPO|nr:hypothetical protein FPCIR_14159 [Fusarium pseudocircinatum]